MVRIQGASQGILYEGYKGDYYQCEFREDDINKKDEVYFFRCDADQGCCGRVCCGDEIWVFPWWGWLLIALLILLILLFLLLLLYLCYRFCCVKKAKKHEQYQEVIVEKSEPPPRVRRAPTPPPKPERPPPQPKPKPKPITTPSSTQTDPPRPKPRPPPEPVKIEHTVQTDAPPPIVSDPMDYIDMPEPEAKRIDYHNEAEISTQATPLLSRADPPDMQRARIMYYRPGLDEVASY